MTGEVDQARLVEAITEIRSMSSDIGEIKVFMQQVAKALNTLALVEDRQARHDKDLARAFHRIEAHDDQIRALERSAQDAAATSKSSSDHDKRLAALEVAQPIQKQSSDIVQRVMMMMLGAVVAAVLALVIVQKTRAEVIPPTFISP